MKVNDAALLISRLLCEKKRDNRRVILAIDGRSASGKTTLARALEELLLATVVHTDDYLLPFDQRSEERMAKIGGHFDYARFLSEILLPWQEGKAIVYQPFDCKRGTMGLKSLLPSSDILIVEGAYSLHPALGFSYDLAVFCHVEAEEQKRRILLRNPTNASRFFDLWIPGEEDYIQKTGIEKKTDLYLNLV